MPTTDLPADLVELARVLQAQPWMRWDLPWCSLPDKDGRVWRRNCSPDDPGFGWSQVAGRRLRCGHKSGWDHASRVNEAVIEAHRGGHPTYQASVS